MESVSGCNYRNDPRFLWRRRWFMARLTRLWATAALINTLACASTTSRAAPAQNSPPCASQSCASPPNLYETQQQVDDYIRSGRYDADVARVASDAQHWLELSAGSAKKPAIVLDIDETSLSNWKAY